MVIASRAWTDDEEVAAALAALGFLVIGDPDDVDTFGGMEVVR